MDENEEILRLRHELLVATNRLKNAEGALIDAGTWCAGPADVVNGIHRVAEELESTRREVRASRKLIADLHGRTGIGFDLNPRNRDLLDARKTEVHRALTGATPQLPGQLGLAL